MVSVRVLVVITVASLALFAGGRNSLCADEPAPAAKDAKQKNDKEKEKVKLPGGIVISKETTRIDGPQRPDGRIDYLAALNQKLSEGVTPDNNAAAPLYQTVGFDAGDAALRTKFFERLGVDPPAADAKLFVGSSDYATRMGGADPDKAEEFRARFEGQLSMSYTQPWNAMERLELAGWLKANERQLATIAAGLRRPRYYMPLVAGEDADYMLVSVLLPGVAACRDVSRAFTARAMLRLGEGKLDEARADLLSAHRLAGHVGSGPTLIEGLVGIACESMAVGGDVALAHSGKLSADDARAYAAELAKISPLVDMVGKIDLTERYMYLDCAMTLAVKGPEGIGELAGGGSDGLDKAIGKLLGLAAIDWNEPLKIGNQWYDRMVEAGRKTPYDKKIEALDAFDDELKKLVEESRDPLTMARRILLSGSPGKAVGRQMGNILIALLLPAVRMAVIAEDRQMEQLKLARLALLLAAYRAEHDAYPETLDALAPKYIKELPRDHFTGEALRYRRTDAGYLLYSVGPNRTDDGGVTGPSTLEGDLVIKTP